MGYGTADGRKLVRGLSGMSCLVAVRIELATGLRRSEVLGLTWSAVDFGRNQLFVHQKLVEEKRRGSKDPMELKVGTPKTKMGTRAVSVDENTMAHLKAWKAVQAEAMALVMPDGQPLTQTEETPVCIGDCGGWMRPSTISRWWEGYEQKSRKKGDEGRRYRREGFRDQIGFPGLCMHELRHTQATQLLGAGVDLKTVQARMGHAKASHTLDLYAHAIPANDRDAANIMGALYSTPAQPSAKVILMDKSASIMKKSTNKSTIGIMSTVARPSITALTSGNHGTGNRVQMRAYELPKLAFAGSSSVTRSISVTGRPPQRKPPYFFAEGARTKLEKRRPACDSKTCRQPRVSPSWSGRESTLCAPSRGVHRG